MTHTPNPENQVLEPCPFCLDGGKPYLHDMQFRTRAHDVAVRCRQCGASANSYSWASGLTHLQDERYAEARRKAVIAWNTRNARVRAGGEGDGISWAALLTVLERLRSKNRNPDNQWYHGWNAAIQCLVNDINARAATTPPAATAGDALPICPNCQQGYVCEHCGEPIGDYYAATSPAPTPSSPARAAAEGLVEHVAHSGVEFDGQKDYIVMQIDRDIWQEIQKLANDDKGDR